MLDLLLINPNSREGYGPLSSLSALEPPLWCALLAAYIQQKGYSAEILDAEVENLTSNETADRIAKNRPTLAAIWAMGINPSASSTPKMTTVGEIIRELKQKAPHIKTMVGGLHPSALPERTLREERPDYVCQGEGFSLLDVLTDLKAPLRARSYDYRGIWYLLPDSSVVSTARAPLVNIDTLPMPAWDLLPMEKYRAHNWHCLSNLDRRSPYGVIWTSLGCPYNCDFCNIHSLYTGKPGIRFRSPEKVVKEIDFLVRNYNIRNFKVWDEMFALRCDEDRVSQICDLLIERDYGLNIWAYGRVDTVTEAMLRKMKQAGINWVAYGFESASEAVRRGVVKKFSQEKMRKAIEMTRAVGINIQANFMYGLPDDTLETMRETLEMAKGVNFEWVNFYACVAYPGSQLYQDAMNQRVKLPETWVDYGQYSEGFLPLPTKYLSGKEVLEFRDKAFNEYFSRPEYLNMITQRFGIKAREYIGKILKLKIRRKGK